MIQWDLIPTIIVAILLSQWIALILNKYVLKPILLARTGKKSDDLAEQLKKAEVNKK